MSRRYVQTVEQTGKLWKLQMLLAFVLCAAGVTQTVLAFNDRAFWYGVAGVQIGPVLLAIGVCWFLFVRIASWWFHG